MIIHTRCTSVQPMNERGLGANGSNHQSFKQSKSLLRTRQQMNGCEPIHQRPLAALEQCTRTQSDDMLAGRTLPA